MTIQEVRAEKAAAEKKIRDALQEFYDKTRCPVTSVIPLENGAECIVAIVLKVEV